MHKTLAILAALILPAPALAASDSPGLRIAQACKPCHSIGVRGASPDAKAPPFRTLAKKYPLENLQEGFAEGVVVGHSDGMPNVRLTPDEIAAFLDWLKSIQR